MELHLLRHGIAAERDDQRFPEDSQRPLTVEGIRKTRRVARAIVALKITYDAVLTSPYVRAKQTADIVAEELGLARKLHLCGALAPGGRPRALVEDIRRHSRNKGVVMLVGHEPDLSHFAALLISGRPNAGLTFKKAGLCVLDVADLVAGQCASLEYLLPPRLLTRLIS